MSDERMAAQGPLDRGVSRKWWQCQRCGENIGVLGRMLLWLPWGHHCSAEQKAFDTRPPIEPGQQWVLSSSIDDGSPWPVSKTPHPVTIGAVQSGWVRYGFGGVGIFSDERMEEDLFRRIYRMPANVELTGSHAKADEEGAAAVGCPR